VDGLRAVLSQLDGLELPARAWERHVLPARVRGYEPSMLDMLCLTGETGWARLSTGPTHIVGATPIALFLREHADAWLALRQAQADARGRADGGANRHGQRDGADEEAAGSNAPAEAILLRLQSHGAAFAADLAATCHLTDAQLRRALHELVSAVALSSDGFAGLRGILQRAPSPSSPRRRSIDQSGRWFEMRAPDPPPADGVETLAWALLRRYGVVCRRLLTREDTLAPWRDLVRVFRRLEARGEIRGGRFVSGMSGEQYALSDAVERLREIRRTAPDDRLVTISAADPLNLTGILTSGDRIRVSTGSRIVYRNGVAVAAMEGDLLRTLAELEPDVAAQAAAAAAGRTVPVVRGYVGRRA
jgi:ATP-dependent Lhr-like helicase